MSGCYTENSAAKSRDGTRRAYCSRLALCQRATEQTVADGQALRWIAMLTDADGKAEGPALPGDWYITPLR